MLSHIDKYKRDYFSLVFRLIGIVEQGQTLVESVINTDLKKVHKMEGKVRFERCRIDIITNTAYCQQNTLVYTGFHQ